MFFSLIIKEESVLGPLLRNQAAFESHKLQGTVNEFWPDCETDTWQLPQDR